MGAGFTLDPSGKVATSLNGAQVLFDGRPAPMIYGSAWQANVIVPYEVAAQATTTISLQFGGVTSAAWTVPVAAAAPAVVTLAASGLGPACYLGTSPEFWLKLQVHYELRVARQAKQKEIERAVRPRNQAA